MVVTTQARAWPPLDFMSLRRGREETSQQDNPDSHQGDQGSKTAVSPGGEGGQVVRAQGRKSSEWGPGDRDWVHGDPGQGSAGKGSLSAKSWGGGE